MLAACGLGRGVVARSATSSSVAAGYLLLLVLYSGPLKHIVIIDVLTIAIGFVLRVVGRRGRHRRADQPVAADLHDPARPVPRAEQTPP